MAILRDPRIKIHLRYECLKILSQGLPKYDSGTQGVFRGVKKDWRCQILQQVTASSLFGHFKIIGIPKKQNAYSRIRTRNDLVEGLEDHHYAIKSSNASQFNWIMYFLSTTEIVIYFTIYENTMLSRRLKIRLNYFFNDFDRK